jgi:GTP-binding protein Era
MDDQTQSAAYHSGFVVIVGKPNVGKSTLINSLLDQKIAAVSFRPQTTRKRQLGILTTETSQIIFIDTPGLHQPDYKLSQFINAEAYASIHNADVILLLVDASQKPDTQDADLAGRVNKMEHAAPVILLLNKWDKVPKADQDTRAEDYMQLSPAARVLKISALHRTNLGELIALLEELLPEGPQLYPPDQVTDQQERDIAADLIRSACLVFLKDEIPHAIAVKVEEYLERDEANAYILATIFVERESHKGIVIGKNGAMLKQIGTLARQEIEQMSGRSVFLELKVKVAPNWRNDKGMLAKFGYAPDGMN